MEIQETSSSRTINHKMAMTYMVKTGLSARVINGKKSKNIKINSLVEPAVLIMYWRENDRYFSFD